jgi:hypothetical protein
VEGKRNRWGGYDCMWCFWKKVKGWEKKKQTVTQTWRSQLRVTGQGGLWNTQVRSCLRSGCPEKRRSGPGLRSGGPWDLRPYLWPTRDSFYIRCKFRECPRGEPEMFSKGNFVTDFWESQEKMYICNHNTQLTLNQFTGKFQDPDLTHVMGLLLVGCKFGKYPMERSKKRTKTKLRDRSRGNSPE